MKRERRKLTRRELASITSRRPVVRKIPRPPEKAHSPGPNAIGCPGPGKVHLPTILGGRPALVGRGVAHRTGAIAQTGGEDVAKELCGLRAPGESDGGGGPFPGEPYKELKQRFKVPIGAMKRHRRAHLVVASDGDEASTSVANRAGEPGEQCYLRFGALPEGGCSSSAYSGYYEDGLSVFAARKVRGGYAVDIPCERFCEGQVAGLVDMMQLGRALYVVASGREIGEGSDGEPLLEDAVLVPVSRFARVSLPEWLGEAGKKFGERWSRRRRNQGRDHSWGLEEEAAQVLTQMAFVLHEVRDTFEERSEGLKAARQFLRERRSL